MKIPHVAVFLVAALAGVVQASEFARSPNFVVMGPDRALADRVLEQAEQFRKEISLEWFGQELPPSVGPAILNVKLSEFEDSGMTWALSGNSARKHHRVWITASEDRVLGATLKHEIAHVVLATWFPERLPSWAEEAVASRYDNETRIESREHLINWYRKTGNWPKLKHVLDELNISATDVAAYSVSVSLSDFLLSRGDKATFFRFAAAVGKDGWDAAADRHYALDDLQTAWQQWAGGARIAANAENSNALGPR